MRKSFRKLPAFSNLLGSPTSLGRISLSLTLLFLFAVNTIPFTSKAATPTIHSNRVTFYVGQVMIIYGSGFTPGNVVFALNGNQFFRGIASSSGTFSPSIRVPDNAPLGSVTLTVTDSIGNVASEGLTINIEPLLFTMFAFQNFALNGVDFLPSHAITIAANSKQFQTTTNATGDFSAPIIASLPFGTYSISATDGVSTATLGATFDANFALSSYSVAAGGKFVVYGAYFTPNTLVSFTLNEGGSKVYPEGSVTSNSVGAFEATISLSKTLTPTSYVFRAKDVNMRQHQAGFTITPGLPYPKIMSVIQTRPFSLNGQNPLKISGTGFVHSVPVKFYLDGKLLGSITSNSTGGISGTVSYSGLQRSGNHNVTATDGTGTAQTTLKIGKYISASSYSVTSGQPITIIGSGFSPSTNVTLQWLSPSGVSPVSVLSNSTEGFRTTLAAPTVKSTGSHKLEALVGSVSENNVSISISP